MKNLTKSLVRIEDHDQLLCPRCNANNLHQKAVTVFHREENEDIVRRIYVVGDEMVSELTDSDTSGNPSSSRQGLTIHFWCEHCHGSFVDENGETTEPGNADIMLDVYQHKGITYIEWRHTL